MLQPFAIAVSVDRGEVYEVSLPWVAPGRFRGKSPAKLYDDAALYLMERVLEASQEDLPDYAFCPEVHFRRVKVHVTFRDDSQWRGRLGVALRRWPQDGFYEATIPRLGLERFLVASPGDLVRAVPEALRAWAGKDASGLRNRLGAAVSPQEYLDFLEVDLELPTILPKTTRRVRPPETEETEADRAARRRQTPPTTLREVGVNLMHRALDGAIGHMVGRERITTDVIARLRTPGAAVLLVGPSGAGKTAIIEAVVAQLATEEARLHARRDVWLVDANRIIAGMSVVGQWEARCAAMIDELSARGDILVVDDLPALVRAGRTNKTETNVARMMEPHLVAGELRVVAECTAERLEALRDEAPAFFARFHVVQVPSLDEATSLRVLARRIRDVETAGIVSSGRAQLRVSPAVPETALSLSRRFLSRSALPGRAVRLLDALIWESPSQRRNDDGHVVLDRNALIDVFQSQTGLPRFVLWEGDGRAHGDVLEHFGRRIVGQPAAVDAAAAVVTTLQQGLNDPNKPIASLLLVGPTGVGKTETAKALAEYLFGSSRRLIRFDMSELQDVASATRLFGDAFRPDGDLTRRVRQQPFAIVLFDEVEKAHRAVFDALLQVLGEGRLTAADGRTTDFCNTVVVMTSNLGVKEAESLVGFAAEETPDRSAHYVAAARAFFRPEFFNRIDRIVPYGALARRHVRPLVERILQEILGRRGLRRSGVLVSVEEELIERWIDRGFDARYGARALRRTVEQEVAVPLARRLVDRPSDGTTWVSLFRSGEGMGIDVWPLDVASRVPPRPLPGAITYAALRVRLDEASAWVTEAEASLRRLREENAEALRAYERDALAGDMMVRFDADAHMQWELLELVSALDAHARDELEVDAFESRVIEVEERLGRYSDGPKRTVTVVTDVHQGEPPVLAARRLVASVEHLRARAFAARCAATDLHGPVERMLLRVLPATLDTRARVFARDLRDAYARVFGGEKLRLEGGFWVPATDGDEPAEGYALVVQGFGLGDRMRSELGFHLESTIDGPDVLTSLVRVEDVAAGDERGDIDHAIARLHALDEEYARFLQERRDGIEAAHPRGSLEVRRRFEQGEAIDFETGVRVLRSTLALEEVMLARLMERDGVDA